MPKLRRHQTSTTTTTKTKLKHIMVKEKAKMSQVLGGHSSLGPTVLSPVPDSLFHCLPCHCHSPPPPWRPSAGAGLAWGTLPLVSHFLISPPPAAVGRFRPFPGCWRVPLFLPWPLAALGPPFLEGAPLTPSLVSWAWETRGGNWAPIASSSFFFSK